ncbi:DUF3019 domain-containing protein [Shewanella sp. HN-41]|uniref:DUF3019 domain-containing protein n=1 Tax=Shewanella sp. HN-41 TaxID=327275 RepID=UPI00021269A5|nr:DUF3019 domain-containing protein [Shewanella sp. HN-41]EGM68948.1 hypothetical protein SOHN41_03013 [Shewanella sp. HN-41]
MAYPRISLLCVLGLSLGLMDLNPAQAASSDVSSLKLTPEICITGAEGEACEIRVELRWELPRNEPICILSDNADYPKWCSDTPEQQSISLNVSTLTDIHFVLVSKKNNQTLAGAKLKITSTSQPQVRRRYRNPWSLF